MIPIILVVLFALLSACLAIYALATAEVDPFEEEEGSAKGGPSASVAPGLPTEGDVEARPSRFHEGHYFHITRGTLDRAEKAWMN